jgi:Uma2 family endonuclease
MIKRFFNILSTFKDIGTGKDKQKCQKICQKCHFGLAKDFSIFTNVEDQKPYTEEEQPVTQVSDLDFSETYTYASYLKWTFEERLELIKGKLFPMSAPNRIHQKLSMEITRELGNYLKGKSCEVYAAPFDVRLPHRSNKDKDITTVVQPDVCVICDPAKLDDKGCLGAPDIVAEILSPGNNRKELMNKYEAYQESGVKEYWVIVPQEKAFWRYTLNNEGKYLASRPLTPGDTVTTPILPGFSLDLEELFGQLP